jgi:hypothetical protein
MSDTTRSIKVRNGNEVRRFAFPAMGSFASLCDLVKQLFVLPETPSALKWRDEEGDLVTLSSDLELADALRASQVLVLVLDEPTVPAAAPKQCARKFWGARKERCNRAPALAVAALSPAPVPSAPQAITSPAVTSPALDSVPVPVPSAPQAVTAPTSPAPATAPVPVSADQKQACQQWKQERMQIFARWREEKECLRAQIKKMKEGSGVDKAALKETIQGLKQQLWEHKKELRRCPREAIAQARFVKDVTLPDGTQVAPGSQLVKTWRFRNETGKAWPENCQLLWVGQRSDAALSAPAKTPVPSCQPAQEVDVSVAITAPKAAGRYTAYFRIADSQGRKFGQRVWISITVLDASSSDEEEKKKEVPVETYGKFGVQLRALNDMGFADVKLNVRLLSKFNGQMENVVAALLRRHQRKLGMASQ